MDNKQSAKCFNCGNFNEVKVSSGMNKPENKGKQYFNCSNPDCKQFNWVENGVGVSTGGFKKVDYSQSTKPDPSVEVRQPVNQSPKSNFDLTKSQESRNMMAMSALKASSEITKSLLDAGFKSEDIDQEVMERMKKYFKAVQGISGSGDGEFSGDLPF